MTLILDAGAFLALERNDRSMWRRLKATQTDGNPPITHGGVLAQVWRGGHGRQTRLAIAVRSTIVLPLDEKLGRQAGLLLARSGLRDAVDAAVISLAQHGDQIATSDPKDLAQLVEASGRRIDIIAV